MTMALEGTRVLDMCRNAVGFLCTMMLGDMGADVIKVEEAGPPTGRRAEQAQGTEPARPSAEAGADRYGPWFAPNRNKRSIALNLKEPVAREAFLRLAKTADVVVEGFRPGVTKRLGVDYETLKGVNPRIIYCAITGYGQDGPYWNLVGHDLNYISMAGALGITGKAGGPPQMPGFQLGDFAGGSLHATVGILMALLARERTGRGQFVDTALADGVMNVIGNHLSNYFSSRQVPRRGEFRLGGSAPNYNVYECKDGKYISLGSLEPWFYANLCRAMGREDFIPLANAEGREKEMISEHFRKTFKTKTRDQWFDLLKNADVCVGKVYDFDEMERDPQIRHRQMIVDLPHPELGKVTQLGIAVKLSETPGSIRGFAPKLGEHTDSVLQELGYTKAQLKEMRQKGAIG